MRALLLLAVSLSVPACAQAPQPGAAIIIRSDSKMFDSAPPVSDAVVKVLLATPSAKFALNYLSADERENAAKLFRAAEIHVRDPDEDDMIVSGRGWMNGADNDWFWIVRTPHTHPEVIFFDGGSTVELLNTRTNGYKDIRVFWSSAAESVEREFRFIRGKYRRTSQKSKPVDDDSH